MQKAATTVEHVQLVWDDWTLNMAQLEEDLG